MKERMTEWEREKKGEQRRNNGRCGDA